MAIEINITHNNQTYYGINLAQAAELIGMAKSTFSSHWRTRVYDDDQKQFDHIKSLRRGYTQIKPRKQRIGLRAEKAIERDEMLATSKIQPYIDRFIYGRAELN